MLPEAFDDRSSQRQVGNKVSILKHTQRSAALIRKARYGLRRTSKIEQSRSVTHHDVDMEPISSKADHLLAFFCKLSEVC